MKKEKFLSLTLLFLLSGSYLAPGVALTETVSKSARKPREEQGESRSSQADEEDSAKAGEKSADQDDKSKKEKSGPASSQDSQERTSDQNHKEDQSVDSRETETDRPSNKVDDFQEEPSDGQPQSHQEVGHPTKEPLTKQNQKEMPDDYSADKQESPTAQEPNPNQPKESAPAEQPAKTEDSGTGLSDQKLPKSSLPAFDQQSSSVASDQSSILVSPFFDAYWLSQPQETSFSHEDQETKVPLTYTTYVDHWSGQDAYTHNLLSHRYGIKAEQLDGYLNSLGLAYDSHRINGKLLLQWEKETGLDVRAIIAIALHESSLGTAGVASLPGSNMFGYGAFDNNPANASHFNDDQAISKMVGQTLIQNKNWTFKIQDDKALKYAQGRLDAFREGAVYFTDTSGTGRRRAQTMQDIDTWIDQHGGTPKIPEKLRHLNALAQVDLPVGYQLSRPMNPQTYLASSYPWGQCTWYVYNRAHELGYDFDPYMGNGGDWQFKSGYDLSHQAKEGYAISFAPGQAGADPDYGHVAIVEQVKKDGSILISEANALGPGVISYRTFSAEQAAELTYVIGKRPS